MPFIVFKDPENLFWQSASDSEPQDPTWAHFLPNIGTVGSFEERNLLFVFLSVLFLQEYFGCTNQDLAIFELNLMTVMGLLPYVVSKIRSNRTHIVTMNEIKWVFYRSITNFTFLVFQLLMLSEKYSKLEVFRGFTTSERLVFFIYFLGFSECEAVSWCHTAGCGFMSPDSLPLASTVFSNTTHLVTIAIHLHPGAQRCAHKWQFHLLNTYIHTHEKKVSKSTWSRNHFHTEQENITIQILYACSVWTHHSPGLLSSLRVTGVFAECRCGATCSLLARRAHIWTVTREIQVHINNLTLSLEFRLEDDIV